MLQNQCFSRRNIINSYNKLFDQLRLVALKDNLISCINLLPKATSMNAHLQYTEGERS